MEVNKNKNWINFLLPGKRKAAVEPIIAHPDARPMEWDEKETIKENYTDGREYFLFAGDIEPRRHQLIALLKAFSQFKKWQKSEMKLVITGNTTKRTAELNEKLATYKYKQDVIILQDSEISVQLQLIAAAYAFVYLDNKDIFSASILNAFQSRVPVIVSKTPEIEKMMESRGILIAPDDHEELARNLLILYKDEIFRKALIDKTP